MGIVAPRLAKRERAPGRKRRRRRLAKFFALAVGAVPLAAPHAGFAETLYSTLARTYQNNPELNQRRASVRARDEETTKALSGMRPKAGITASAGPQYSTVKIPSGRNNLGQRAYYADEFIGYPRGAALNVSQTLFDGGRTASAARQAESGALSAHAGLFVNEQTILQNGVKAYMDVLRDTAIVALRKNNIAVLTEQLRQTRERFRVGEVTVTDVAQSEASLEQGRSDFYNAQAMLKMSMSAYRRIVGVEPKHLEPATGAEKLLPRSAGSAETMAVAQHPSVISALHQVDAAEHAVKVAESALSPTVSLNAQVSPQWDSFLGWPGTRQFAAAATGSLNIPLYQGGSEYASIRQAKEQLSEARLGVDLARENVRAMASDAFAQLEAAKTSIVSSQAAVKAAEKSLWGVRQEARVGQRTTLDVLNAHQALVAARVNLVMAQHDRVVASYAALAAIGRLTASDLNLDAALYDPQIHYEEVKDKWFGLDTSDGR
jgi:outer membrane protein